ncbi:MAG: cytidine deaminase [Myxococcales bacterium]|nr:cytidine deaminase [Myxococcales bacterium]
MSEHTLDSVTEAELLKSARLVQANAYAPYSRFNVGAALLTSDGETITGCNVECASYGSSMCAERNAIAKAVSMGKRDFVAVAVVTDGPSPTPPCGACRQVLAEFSPDMLVVFSNGKGTVKSTIAELLPHRFDAKQLP